MMDIDLSVIVPVFNAERTIKRCIASILYEAPDNIELLIINDGSSDGTDKICEYYRNHDPRVRYISKSNGGVSSARNMGIQLARGKYLCFVDSDDFLRKGFYRFVSCEMASDYDMIIFGRCIYDGKKYYYCKHKSSEVTRESDLTSYICNELKKQRLNLSCDKLFKRSLLIDYKIQFPEELDIGEDKVFVVEYASICRSIRRISDLLYVTSLENQDSLSRKIKTDLCDKVLLEHQLMLSRIGRLSYKKRNALSKAICYSYYRSAYTVIHEIDKYSYDNKTRDCLKKDVCKRYVAGKGTFPPGSTNIHIALPIICGSTHVITGIVQIKSWIDTHRV